jgi:hypothetical protein
MARPEAIVLVAREAMYYGAESFYLHQFSSFSRNRYRDDAVWLLQNAGISIRPTIDIANFIVERVNLQITSVGSLRAEGREFNHSDLTNSLLISKAGILGSVWGNGRLGRYSIIARIPVWLLHKRIC